MLVRTTFALIATASAAVAAPAPETATRETLRQYCTGDYLSFCGEFGPDTPEVQACFKKNKPKLSPNCQAAITSYMKGQKRAEAR